VNSVLENAQRLESGSRRLGLSTLATLGPEENVARFLNAAPEEDELKDRLPGGKKNRPSTASSPRRDCDTAGESPTLL
jgi:hypothetical protein